METKRKSINIRMNEEEYQEYLEKLEIIKNADLVYTQKDIFNKGLNTLYEKAKQIIDNK